MRLCVFAVLLLALCLPLLAQETVPVIPLKPDPPIAVDGDLKEWAGVPNVLTITGKEHATYNPQTWKGPADLGALMHLAWRSEGLYLGLEITDDAVVQTQRDEKMYQGDHVEVFIDTVPDVEPERHSFGPGQFQFAFSPGNFKTTGDALVDIKPEMYCYQPKGGSCEGIKYAAVRTGAGWTLEAMVPFALLKVNPVANMALGLEVALSDCDSFEPAQETFYTISTKQWEYGRANLGLFVLGDVAGKGTPPPKSVKLAEALTVPYGKTVDVTLPKVEVPAGKDAFLCFSSRIEYTSVAGYSNALQARLNGADLGADRLTNREVKATRNNGAVDNVITPDGLMYTPYAPDFVAVNQHPDYGMQGNVKPCEWEFRITDLLKAEGNVLQFQNHMPPAAQYAVALGGVEIRIKAPPPPPAPKRPAPTGPLAVIAPRTVLKTAYTARETGAGQLEVKVGGETYRIASRFSTPDGKWQSASCPSFSFQRQLEVKPEWVIVRDTFKNLTSENLPLMQRHTCDLKGLAKKFWCSGISPASGEIVMSDPQNPTSYAVTAKTGLGLMAWNDEFQVHVTNSALGGILGLADQSMVLAPGRTYTAEWIILPVARPDFWDLVNVSRRARDANFTLGLQSAWISTRPEVESWSDDMVRAFVRNKGVNVIGTGIEHPRYNGMYAHGTVFQGLDLTGHARAHDRWRTLCPGVKATTYFHCFLDVGENAAEKYADAKVLLANGQQANYGQPYDRIFFPTLTNQFGADIAKNVDAIFDRCKADGVYWDEMDYSAYKYHYGEPWDGCSADLDPQTGKIIRLKSSVTLLSQPFRKQLAEKIIKRGFLQCNGAPHTRTMAALHYPCFVETAAISNCLRAILYSPVALGDHISERTGVDAYRWMLGALDYGCLYNWYDYRVKVDYPTLSSYMFPTTPLELHEGYIIGKERIVTKVSGLFGWGDKSRHEVHVFDAEGREVKDFKAPTVVKDGKTYTELRIAEDWSAAIIRK